MKKEPTAADLLSRVKTNINNPEFAYFLSTMMMKWDNFEREMEVVDDLLILVCKEWEIDQQQLLMDKKYREPRSVFFYLFKRYVSTSYEVMEQMFNRRKSQLHKMVEEIRFVVENGYNKPLLTRIEALERSVTVPPLP